MGFIEDHEKELRSQRDAYVSDMIGKLKIAREQIEAAQLRGDRLTIVSFGGPLDVGDINKIHFELDNWFDDEPSPHGPVNLSMGIDDRMGHDTITAYFN